MLQLYHDILNKYDGVNIIALIIIIVSTLMLADKMMKKNEEVERKMKKHDNVLAAIAGVVIIFPIFFGLGGNGYSGHIARKGDLTSRIFTVTLGVAAIISTFYLIMVIYTYICVFVRRKKKTDKQEKTGRKKTFRKKH